MINRETAEQIRLLVEDIHERGEIVQIYRVAQQIPTLNGGHDLMELTDAIAKEAMRIHAAMSWHKDEAPKPDGQAPDAKPAA